MGVLKLAGFTGMWPQRDPRALPDNAATYAENIRVDGGQYLRGVPGNVSRAAISGATLSVFRIPLPGANTFANSYWMQFADVDTDVVRGPLTNDSYERFYWASPSTGLKFAAKADIILGSTGYESGVAAPSTALTATVVGGTGEIVDGENVAPEETRVYTVTFINDFGEESQPGPTTEVIGHSDQDYSLTSIPQPPAPGSKAPYDTIRIYRTVSGVTGNTGFYKVVDLAVGTTLYTDQLSHAVVTGQTPLESTAWAIAPSLDGIVAMPNGMLVGWNDNNLYFSENYRLHAWPSEYMITVDFPIVGLGVFGNSCVVCTTGNPYVVTGTKASSMSLQKIGEPLPCLYRGSIVSTPAGVLWATDRGLASVGPGGAGIATDGVISREDWQTNYIANGLRATLKGGDYLGIIPGLALGFVIPLLNLTERGISWVEYPVAMDNIGTEPWTGKQWGITTTNFIHELEVPATTALTWTWRSKEFTYPLPTNFRAFQCFYDETAGNLLHMKVWATLRGNDGSTTETLVFDQDLTTSSGRERRLPSGFKSEVWKIEFSGTVELQSFAMATSVAELRGV
jgi:hypothetical protein